MLYLEALAVLDLLDVQAGGGGSFGSGPSGGGGGDGDGIGFLVYLLIRLAIEYPPIGVPLLIAVVVVGAIGSRRGWWKHQERTIRRGAKKRARSASVSAAKTLQAGDPAFDEGRFLERVKHAFLKAQRSWCDQDLEPLRPFVSDGVFERFSLQIEEQKEDGWRQGMAGTTVGPLAIVHVEAGAHFDSVTVRIPFRSDVHRIDLESGKRISGSRLPRNHFTECWTFLRRRGAKTLASDGLLEGQCPNCGALLAVNQSAKCGTCDCLARSGEFDWVLVEITQASEWSPEPEPAIPGLAAYAERDPGINVQALEDRASVAFWRLTAAVRAGSVDPLTRVADAALCERYAAELAGSGERSYLADRAVGSVRTLGILPGEKRDRAVIEVVWDGRGAEVDADGERRLSGDKRRRLRRTLFVFARDAGRQTSLETSFTTTHCANCGAHDTGGTAPACPYCEAPRTGDRSTWLLTDVVRKGAPSSAELFAELRALPARPRGSVRHPPARLLAWAGAVVRADGEVDAKEKRALLSLAARHDIDADRVELLVAGAENGAELPHPRNAEEAHAWMEELVEVALADGALGRAERRFLRHAAESTGVAPSALGQSIRRKRSELYRATRRAKVSGSSSS